MEVHTKTKSLEEPAQEAAKVTSLARDAMKEVMKAELRLDLFSKMRKKNIGSKIQEDFLNMLKIQIKARGGM